MLELMIANAPGKWTWKAHDLPSTLAALSSPFCLQLPGRTTGVIRSYSLQEGLKYRQVQSMGHHARSVYLGHDDVGSHYFAKGVGWCLSPGWNPSRGSTGILPRWAAERERDLSRILAELGILVPHPVGILEFDALPGTDPSKPWIPASEVHDLDGSNSHPSVYIYRHSERFRLADLALLPPASREDVAVQYWHVLEKIRAGTEILHRANGHDYSLSLHNVWLDGSRVDFEYVVLGHHPHRDSVLNADSSVWQAKEWMALRCLAFELADILGLEADAELIALNTHAPAKAE